MLFVLQVRETCLCWIGFNDHYYDDRYHRPAQCEKWFREVGFSISIYIVIKK